MKHLKRILILTLVMLTLVGISSVCAGDVNDTADLVIDENNVDSNLAIGEHEVIAQTDNNGLLSQKDDGTFTALQNKINNASSGSIITLENDYTYDEGFKTSGIVISKSLTINGNGHTLNGLSNSRILHIESDGVVILKNIKFTNANDGALFVTPAVWDYDYQIWYIDCDLKIDECTFINNKGGAINGPTDGDIIITNSTFTNNQAKYGGAINTYANLDITNCKFTGNFANYYGGAINSELSSDARSGKEIKVLCINKCTFTKNTAEDGGAISSERILLVQNSIFKDNTATKNGQYYASSIAAKGESIKLVKCNFSGYESKEIVCINGKITTTNCLFKTPIKLTPKLTAKKATFKVKTKTKKYSVILKTNKNKAMKKVKLYLKVKGKTYTAKTDSKGKATFKITKLTKKGTYNAVITFKGNNNYKKVAKTVKIKVK